MARTKSPPNSFKLLREELRYRIHLPVGQVSFWAYLVLGVVAFGGLGIWLEIYRLATGASGASLDSLKTAAITYAPTLVGSSMMQLVLADGPVKYLRSFGWSTGLVSLAGSMLLIVHQDALNTKALFVLAAAVSAFAVGLWWVANGTEKVFQDTVSADDPVGGDLGTELPGSTDGFEA